MRRDRVAVMVVTALALGCAQGAAAHVPKGFFGINAPAPASAGEAKQMARGGVETVRFTFDWRVIEPTETSGYTWGSTDARVSTFVRRHMRILPTFYSTPTWLTHDYHRPPLRSKEARSRWRKLLTAAVNRYGPHGQFWTLHPGLPYLPLRHWQVWNEPNLPGFFAPKASPKRYARLLRISAKAIRRASGKAKVVLAGLPLTGGRPGQILSYRFFRQLYVNGAKGDFDIIAVHPYAYRVKGTYGVGDQIRRMRKVARRHGNGGMPIWIDEIGWSSLHKGANNFAEGRKGQAKKLRSSFHFVVKHRHKLGVGRLIWFKWRDDSSTPAECAFCAAGVQTANLHSKPAWRAYKRITG